MSPRLLTSLLTAAVVALAAVPASAQNVFDPTSWFAPQRPCYDRNYAPQMNYRPVYQYPSYAGPVGNSSSCPDGLCGPSYHRSNGYRGSNGNCPNGQCGPTVPRYPMPSNSYSSPAPMPSGWNGNTGIVPPSYHYNNRVTPTRYEDQDEWPVTRLPYNGRNYGPSNNNSPFYP